MNSVILIGRIGNDLEIKTLNTGTAVCAFDIAVRKQDNSTMWIKCVAWRTTAELLHKYCRKGDMIGVCGSINVRKYEKDNETRQIFEINVSSIHFCGKKEDKSEKIYQGEQNKFSDDLYKENDKDLPF